MADLRQESLKRSSGSGIIIDNEYSQQAKSFYAGSAMENCVLNGATAAGSGETTLIEP